jgi:GntR family transcriptional regulator/MocR family aminotransferase
MGLTHDFVYPPQPADHICFSRWSPDVERFPLALWRKLLTRHLRTADRTMLDYARQSQGHEPLRKEIAAYVARSRAVECTPEQVVILNGSQQALELCARVLCERGDVLAFENPGYLGTKRIFDAHGVRLAPARIDSQGIIVGDIARQARLVYVTPSHQFPTGVAMTLARRLELIAWARRQNAVILEDDYDSEYRYSGAPLPALQGLANGVPVVYVGTFSNVMFRGIRIGYVVVPSDLVAPFTRAKWLADRHSPLLDQAALAVFMGEGHLERHIRRMRRLYRSRREALVGALERHLGDAAVVHGDAAGMHALVRFRAADVRERARRHAVRMASADPYYLSGRSPNEFILGFAAIDERTIVEGVKRLGPRPN